MISALFAKIGAKAAMIGGAIAAVALFLWTFGRAKKREGAAEVVQKSQEKALENVKTRKRIEKDVRDDDRSELDKRLRDTYRD